MSRFNNGLILCWGYCISNETVNLPITFTTKYQITATHWDSGDGEGSTYISYWNPGSSLSSVHFGGGRPNVGLMYIAMGF